MVCAPPGYTVVGAKMDSEDVDSGWGMRSNQFGMHNATASGWMALEGTKSAGTDLRSKPG
jgi:DNA polymerase gamma 1